ncbi:hypothetical protein [Marinococcus luteus]|uniref:hypothetical protein n=1 Tax=Marinococcus luteus TaxID=1122204 RepID=UPI002ACC9D63|nr:hypothetical protein [Marinococcus luteus]MDZ5783378.1 hypothetical protein [Marinococcus luteus]
MAVELNELQKISQRNHGQLVNADAVLLKKIDHIIKKQKELQESILNTINKNQDSNTLFKRREIQRWDEKYESILELLNKFKKETIYMNNTKMEKLQKQLEDLRLDFQNQINELILIFPVSKELHINQKNHTDEAMNRAIKKINTLEKDIKEQRDENNKFKWIAFALGIAILIF